MAISREEARARHTAETGHEQFSEAIYGVICDVCHNYVLMGPYQLPALLSPT